MLVFGYLVGSIPTGVLVGRVWRGVDVREQGSGSSGGTNVARVLGWGPGVLVILLDGLKGFLAVRSVAWLAGVGGRPHDPAAVAAVAGLCAVVGHVWPIFARLRGGKGVATSAGVLLAVSPAAFGMALASFGVLLAVGRIVSVASIGASIMLVVVLVVLRWVIGKEVPDPLLMLSLTLALIIAFSHRANLARLRSGTEPSLGRAEPRRDGTGSP
jgi:glycerol-3-phosphate acyltransferase PlsY